MERELAELPLVNALDRRAPALRRELNFRPQRFGKKSCYVVEDPLNARFFQIGLGEYTFISLLDGRSTVGEVLRATKAALPACAFTPSDALAICQWVLRNGLAKDQSITAADLRVCAATSPVARRSGGRLSPLSMQLPFVHPDGFFTRWKPWLCWCFSWPALVGWCVVIGWALCDLAVHSQRLFESTSRVLAVGNWLWLGGAWVGLKVLHECGHAVACKRLGGEVREAGVIFILLAPLAYVDVTSTWRLRSKWARIQVAAAGMYVELFVAALATLVWARTPTSVLNQVCFNVMSTAGVMTVLFNANPLMRFDGYYIVSDLLELPNLYTQGQQYVAYLCRWFFFGMRPNCPVGGGVRGVFTRWYGVASCCWRYSVFGGLLLKAATLLEGAGIILSAAAVMLWLASAARRLACLARDPALTLRRWTRCALAAGAVGGLAAAGLLLIPWPGTVVAPGIVRYAPETVVRTESDGFIREIRVDSGQQVKPGDVLIVLANPELEHELSQLGLEIEACQLKRRIHQQQREMAKVQAAEEKLRTLESRHAEKREQVAHLVVLAPCAGKIIGRNLRSLPGTWLKQGSDLLVIANEGAKEIRVSIAQEDIDAFRACVESPLRAYLPESVVLQVSLAKIEPRASTLPLDPALCAPLGGSLAVRRVSDAAGHKGRGQFELLSPRFTGVMPLGPVHCDQLHAGQRAVVAVRPRESLGGHLYRKLIEWMDAKLHRPVHSRAG